MKEYENSITLNNRSSREERESALHQIYNQILGRQPYQYERKLLASAEKDFLQGKSSVKRFLKCLGQSDIYLDSYYHNSSNLKFLDWCFKHFMGRAPQDKEEIQYYCDILMRLGVKELITALLDSEEYRKVFGNFTVPHTHEQNHYTSPKAYWETNILTHEHFSQRGRVIPTMYWHSLGLNCDAGVCHPEVDGEFSGTHQPAGAASDDMMPDELMEFLKALGPTQARQLIASMTPKQKQALYQAIH